MSKFSSSRSILSLCLLISMHMFEFDKADFQDACEFASQTGMNNGSFDEFLLLLLLSPQLQFYALNTEMALYVSVYVKYTTKYVRCECKRACVSWCVYVLANSTAKLMRYVIFNNEITRIVILWAQLIVQLVKLLRNLLRW